MQFFYVYRRIELQKDMKHMVQYAKPQSMASPLVTEQSPANSSTCWSSLSRAKSRCWRENTMLTRTAIT